MTKCGARSLNAAEPIVPHDADAFLQMLGERHTFQTFDDASKQRSLSRVLHGTLVEHIRCLASLNSQGAGVFVMVNQGDEHGRTTMNVRSVRALFVDLDGAPVEPLRISPLAPHCIVETSPSRWHAYWRVADCPLLEFTTLQKALAARFNGDTKVCDLARVMRIPGFEHRKLQPFLSRIVQYREHNPYTLAEVRAAFGFSSPANTTARSTLPRHITRGERNDRLFSLGRGFVCQGIDAAGVNQRLQRINAERCQPPLCAAEVDSIAANASAYGSGGFAQLPHVLLDSSVWRALAPAQHDIILRAFRRFNGVNNGRIALPYSDFAGLRGFANRAAFYGHRTRVIASGILIRTHEGGLTRNGRETDLFAIAEPFLVPAIGRKVPHAQR